MKEIRLEAMKLAFQAAIQYGAFDVRNLTPIQRERDFGSTHNWGEHYEAIESVADAIYAYVTKDDETQNCIPPHLEAVLNLHKLRNIDPNTDASDYQNEKDK